MVDKIDRPKAPDPWTIKATAGTKDRGQSGQQAPPEDEFSSPGNAEEWHGLHEKSAERRIIRVHRETIRHLWFRRARLQQHVTLVECGMELADGTFHEAVQCILPMDEYLRLKGYSAGQEIPVTLVVQTPTVDVSVPLGTTGGPAPRPAHAAAPRPASGPAFRVWHLLDPVTAQVRVTGLLFYGLAILATIAVVMALL